MAQAQDDAPPRGIAGALRGLTARVRRASPGARVWVLSGALAVTAAVLYLLLVRDGQAPISPIQIPWWVIATLFLLADLKVIEVHFRRESHAFSLSELPTVLGLFFLAPGDYLLALVTGTGVALWLTSRQAPIKLAFNLANYVMLAVVTMVVFRTIQGAGGPPGFVDYMAAFIASLVATGVGAVSIASAITLSGGAPQFKKLPEMLQFGALVAVANTSIALLTVTVLWTTPGAVWLLAIPVVTLFLAYRAYVSEREKHERLELVYESSRILQHSPELDVALLALLDHARAMFRAELAEVVLQPSNTGEHPLRTSSIQDAASEVIAPIERMEVDPALRSLIEEQRAGFAQLPRTPGGREMIIRQAMVAPLVGESGMIGLLTIANRLTEGTAFGEDDLRLLETLANQAAVALENGQLEQSLAELSRLKEQLRYQAYHDPLTDLPNRSQFVEQATERIRRSTADGEPRPVVLLLDLDDFKIVNDTLGHAAGDELLVMVSERIRACVRDGDLAARLGGDEFAILVDDESSLTDSISIARRLIDVLGISFPIHGEDVLVGVSIGIAMGTGPQQAADELVGNADVAMYTAKAAGKRRFAVFNPTMHAAIIARHELSAELTRGIGRSELIVHHQPIVELRSGRTVGFEALVRWRHPARGVVRPEEFISLAEESGAIVPLGRYVLAEAAREMRAWMDEDRARQPYLSVNVSAVQVQQPDFLDEVEATLEQAGLLPERLVLEITETAMFRDTQATIHKLQALRERGVRIAIDDFGTGYSSLTYLRRFPVDIIKIAQEFIGPPDLDTEEWAFTGAILDLGRRLGLQVIAEGIEEPGQLVRLRSLGCEYGQGFLFARPAPLANLPTRFAAFADAPGALPAALGRPARPAHG